MFLGVSAGGVLKPEMVEEHGEPPVDPRARQPEAGDPPGARQGGRGPTRSSRPAGPTIRTRSTTSSCFPFIFRGALDVGATTINEEMKLAAVRAIAELAQAEQSDVVSAAYGAQDSASGRTFSSRVRSTRA